MSCGRDPDAVEADRVEAAGGVDRRFGRDRDPVGAALDQVAAAVGGGDEEEVGGGGVQDEHLLAVEDDAVAVGARLHREAADGRRRAGVPERRRAAQLARGQRPQEALALVVGAAERERQAGDRVGEERRGGERVAHLLEEDGELDDAEPLPAPLLGQRQAGPAELGHLVPVGLLEAVLALGQLADPLGFVAGGEEVACAVDLIACCSSVRSKYMSGPLAHLRQAEHALGDDVLEDVGGAALDRVGPRAQEAVLPGAVGERVLGAAAERRVGALDVERQLGDRAG